VLAFFYAGQEMAVAMKTTEEPDYTGRENHNAPRRLEANAVSINRGAFMRPTTFETWRSVYWVKPNQGATTLDITVTVAGSLSVAFKKDGETTSSATSNNGVFSESFGLNNGKLMTEIEIIISNGSSERSYYLDVCDIDPLRHDVVVDYYDLLPYPKTTNTTRALVDQIMYDYTVTPKRIEFVADYLAGSQKNLKLLIDPVKARNPNWHSLHYHLAIWNGEAEIIIDNQWTKSEWEYLTNQLYNQDPYIYMYAIDKNTNKTTWVKDVTWGAYLMNISNETYYRYLVENLVYQCKSTGYESIFFDSFSLGIVYAFTNANYINLGAGANVPQQFTEYPHAQLGGLTWLQAMEEFVSRLNKDMNRRGIWLLPNHGEMRTSWDPLDYALTNGGMLEGVPRRPDNGGNINDQNYLGDWILSLSRTMYLTQKDRVIILQPNGGSLTDLNYRMFLIGEYLMVRGAFTFLNLNMSGQKQASWYPEYEIDLGAPTQTFVIPDTLFTPRKASIDNALLNYNEGDLFIRRFEKGIVILNPHNTARQYTIPADRAYKMAVISGGGTVPEAGIDALAYDLNWTDLPVGSVRTIPAVGALILRNATDTDSTDSINGKVHVSEQKGIIQITSYASNPIREVMVYNLQGKMIYKVSAIDALSHTLSQRQPAGAYVVKVISEKHTDIVKIITK